MVAPLALVSVLAGIGRHSLILCVPADRTRDHRELLHKTLKQRRISNYFCSRHGCKQKHEETRASET
jgi:hypothetical protein